MDDVGEPDWTLFTFSNLTLRILQLKVMAEKKLINFALEERNWTLA